MDYLNHQLYWYTIDYWNKWREDNEAGEDTLLAFYIDELLPKEMEGRTLPEPCQTLAMLVGHSIEPLLQTVYWYRPNQIYLLLNEGYTALTKGEDGQHARVPADIFGNVVNRAIEHLASRSCYKSDQTPGIDYVTLKGEQPDHVFEGLLENVGGSENLVIDMTGAKKSMVAGAFLYAAFTGKKVSYVNFPIDAYNPEYGKPYGFASTIEFIENPYTTFALREWEQLRQAYEQHNFQIALELLKVIIQAKPFVSLKESEKAPSAIEGVAKLKEVLSAYAFWNSGDYQAAHKAMQPLTQTVKFEDSKVIWRFEPPIAVTRLGENFWPQYTYPAQQLLDQFTTIQTGITGDPTTSLFLNLDRFVAYVEDELAKIGRLYDLYKDHRSVLLRSTGLNEVLLKARLAILWKSDQNHLTYYMRTHEDDNWTEGIKPSRDKDSLFTPLIKKTFQDMFGFLTGTSESLTLVKNQKVTTSKTMEPYWDELLLHPETLANLRNQAIHVFLSVSPSIAKESIDLTKMNWTKYLENWATEIGEPSMVASQQVTVMPWGNMCRGCGLDQFLSPNLLW